MNNPNQYATEKVDATKYAENENDKASDDFEIEVLAEITVDEAVMILGEAALTKK